MAVTIKNYLDLTGLQSYDSLIKTYIGTGDAKAIKTVLWDSDHELIKFYKKENATLSDTADYSVEISSSDVAALKTRVGMDSTLNGYQSQTNLTDIVNVLTGTDTTTGSVAKALKDAEDYTDAAIADLDTTTDVGVASKSGKAVTITGSVKEENGIVKKGAATDITLADVASTGAAEDVTIADANNKITATNVEGALEELVDAIADATNASKVTCEASDGGAGSDTLKTYSFYQGVLGTDDASAKAAKKIVDINIPKDYVVRSATVGTCTVADQPVEGLVPGDKYIDLAINTNDGTGSGTVRHLYIPFKELMAAIKGSTGTEVTVAVASDNTISATINKIAATKIIYEEGTGGAADITVKNALDTINGDATTAGSINKAKADVIGTASDDADANTINGAKAYANAAINALDTSSDVAIATYDSTNDKIVLVNGISETNGVIGAGSGDGIEITKIATSAINALFPGQNSGS